MSTEHLSILPRARIMGAGAIVTLEDPDEGTRIRVRVQSRSDGLINVEPLPGSGVHVTWRAGSSMEVRAARPFGLFCYRASVQGSSADGLGVLRLEPAPPKRRQLRGYFRMPVRLGVLLEVPSMRQTAPMLRACNLSASGILVHDPDLRLDQGTQVRLGLPIGPSGEILRISGRVVRVQENPRRVALFFEAITEAARQMVLRYLFREHRRRSRKRIAGPNAGARITPLERS